MVTERRCPPPTLDPDEAVEEVGAASRVGSRAPVGPADLVGPGCKAGVLPDLVGQVGRERTVTMGEEDDTWGEEEQEEEEKEETQEGGWRYEMASCSKCPQRVAMTTVRLTGEDGHVVLVGLA